MSRRNIVLVGFMGTGKTSVANLLTQQTGMPLLDMDTIIEARQGKSITRIFTEEGEPFFRQIEHQLAQELSTPNGNIISTGGGIVTNPANIAALARGGLVVCLQASVDEILRRVADDTTRPLLQTPDRKSRITTLLATRTPLYNAIPFQIQTDGKSIQDIAAEIRQAYRQETIKYSD
ncbi:MAG: shikimate kinase [Kiritimatiellia bacterium]